jgi:polyhydroxybutyrate depolymerase
VLASTLLLVGACSGDDDSSSATATTTGGTTAPVPSPACEASGSPRPTEPTTETVDFDGTVREYRLATPDDFSPPAPLILNFHGFSSAAAQQAVYSELETEGPARGYVVATPQGTGNPAFWNILNRDALDDVAYTEALIAAIGDEACIDMARVYSTGISNGAGFSAMLACEIPDQISAIAPVAGINLVAACPDGPPVPVIAFHGEADDVVPYAGGSPAVGARDLEIEPVPDTVAAWAERDGCSDPAAEEISAHVTQTIYANCADGSAVELYTVAEGGHTWPGAIDVPRLGPVTDEIDATDLILDFFDAH